MTDQHHTSNGCRLIGSLRADFARPWIRRSAPLLALALFAVAGCSTTANQAVRTELIPFTPEQKAELAKASTAQYRIRPGDRLAVDFKYEDELDSTDLLVLPDGHLTLPGGVDPVAVKGLTVIELDLALTTAYAMDYRDPDLSVIVEKLADLQVYVFGQVKTPGRVIMPAGGLGVMQAIASAGGFHENARPQETVIMRTTPDGFLLRQIDLSHLEKRGIFDLAALDLQPYDMIYVPRSAIGDFDYFSRTVLEGIANITQIFWDLYAITNLNKVTNIWR